MWCVLISRNYLWDWPVTYESRDYLGKWMQQFTKKRKSILRIQSKILPENQRGQTRKCRPLLAFPSLQFAVDASQLLLLFVTLYPLLGGNSCFWSGFSGILHAHVWWRGCWWGALCISLDKQAQADGWHLAAGGAHCYNLQTLPPK